MSVIKCIKGNELKVISTNAGFYIGTEDKETGLPECHISVGYYKNRTLAQEDLEKCNFIDNTGIEITLCNGGKGCKFSYTTKDNAWESNYMKQIKASGILSGELLGVHDEIIATERFNK